MTSVSDVCWSTDVEQAAWLADQLAVPAGSTVTSVVPGGFGAYARLLHPAKDPAGAELRWSEVAAGGGMELKPDAEFHSVALPPEAPDGPLPECRAPAKGTLSAGDLAVLDRFLRGHTATPEECWFCLWEGYAWQGRDTDPIPAEALEGPRVTVQRRDYVLYRGAVETAEALAGQSPNLWWPADRSWCVASDITVPWTYVGGTQEMVDQLCALEGLEVLPADAEDPVRRVEDWVMRWVSAGAEALMRGGHCRIETTRGAVSAWFERPALTPGNLGVSSESTDGRKSGRRTTVEHGSEEYLHRLVSRHLAIGVIELVEG